MLRRFLLAWLAAFLGVYVVAALLPGKIEFGTAQGVEAATQNRTLSSDAAAALPESRGGALASPERAGSPTMPSAAAAPMVPRKVLRVVSMS